MHTAPDMPGRVAALIAVVLFAPLAAFAQRFSLEQKHDSLSVLTLTTDSTVDRWRLPYPVYQFQTGDVDGDGIDEALVGVVKKTRFHREAARRLFVFRNARGYVRPLWLGSRLGGVLRDFRYAGDGCVLATELDRRGRPYQALYRWDKFGFTFLRYLNNPNNQANEKDTITAPAVCSHGGGRPD